MRQVARDPGYPDESVRKWVHPIGFGKSRTHHEFSHEDHSDVPGTLNHGRRLGTVHSNASYDDTANKAGVALPRATPRVLQIPRKFVAMVCGPKLSQTSTTLCQRIASFACPQSSEFGGYTTSSREADALAPIMTDVRSKVLIPKSLTTA
jgi:hypothetical protein